MTRHTVISLFDKTGASVQPWADAGYGCHVIDQQHTAGDLRENIRTHQLINQTGESNMETYVTVHQHLIEDIHGDVEDAIYFCSNNCHRDYMTICHRDNYNGWNGCNEVMAPEWCANCGEQIT